LSTLPTAKSSRAQRSTARTSAIRKCTAKGQHGVDNSAMLDDDAIEIQFDPPYPDLTYAHYRETCRRAGVTPVSRECASDLMQERGEAVSGRPEPSKHWRRDRTRQARSTGSSPFPGLARLAVRLLDEDRLPVEFLADCQFELPPLAFRPWERLAAHRAIPGARLHV